MDECVPSVTAVVLNWNNFTDTEKCVESLNKQQYSDLNIVIVDNGSDDGSKKKLEERFPEHTLIRLHKNQGFSGGMNAGIKHAQISGRDYVWLLNNDVVIYNPELLKNLISVFNDQSVGLVSPEVRTIPGGEIWFRRGEINTFYCKFNNQTHVQTENRYVENDFVPICCSLLPTEVLDEIGNLEDKYFIYVEDNDLGVSLREEGYQLLTDTNLIAHHKVGQSVRSSFSEVPAYYRTRNRHIFANLHPSQYNIIGFIFYSIWWLFTRGFYAWYENGNSAGLALLRGKIHGILNKTGRGPY